MALCCDTPHLTRLKKIKENREVLALQNGTGMTGTFPTLPRDEMTNVVTPAPAAPMPGTEPDIIVDPNLAPINPGMPTIEPENDFFPGAPSFQVPPNPLLPPEYSETLDYNALQYLNGFYRTQIGRYVRVEQQINSTDIEIRYGYLIGVGINYILLQDATAGNVYAIDSYSIKLFYVYYNLEGPFDPSVSAR